MTSVIIIRKSWNYRRKSAPVYLYNYEVLLILYKMFYPKALTLGQADDEEMLDNMIGFKSPYTLIMNCNYI